MNPRIKGIAVLMAVILAFSVTLGASSAISLHREELFVPPTEPDETTVSSTTEITTQPTPPPTTVPSTTQHPTEPITEPTSPPTTEPPVTEPPVTETPVTEPPTPEEPYSSTNITIGTDVPGITAKKAFVYDCESKSFLYMKSEANAKLYPASITKLMNVYTALQYITAESVLTMTSEISHIVPYDTSKAGLYSGDSLTAQMVIRAALIPSGSDAAHLLAVSAGRVIAGDPSLPPQQAEDIFVEEMNRQASALGLVNTHFVNCDGYPDYYHYTCMADLVTIASICLDQPLIRDTVSCASATVTYADGRCCTVNSTNSLLRPNSAYYRSEARGMKTGTTDAAGSCLLSAFWAETRYILVGVFQCPGNGVRYSTAAKLFDAFSNVLPPETQPDAPSEPSVTEPPATEPTATEPTVTETPISEPSDTSASISAYKEPNLMGGFSFSASDHFPCFCILGMVKRGIDAVLLQ